MFDSVIFREYDIRGVYETQFDLNFGYDLGRAFATKILQTYPNATAVSVGHDARVSGPDISKKVIQGITDCGLNVYFLGLVTSPILYFSTFTMNTLSGGIMVTGSHNPPDYNGFKLSVGTSTIFGQAILDLKEIIQKNNYAKASKKGEIINHDIFPSYLNRYKEEFKNVNFKNSNFKVVLDCGNGAAGCIAKDLYNTVGLDPIILFEKPDGTFPNHHPDPTVEKNLKDLAKAVKDTNAMVGIGFDGDADRIGIVDHTGKMIFGDELMTIVARDILKKSKNEKIIGDVKCSDRMYADIKKNGGIPIMWKTGHSLVKEKIKTEKSPFGGEMSGHIFFADRNYGYDDALYAGLRLCEILVKENKTITQLLEGLPPSFCTPEVRIDTTEEKKQLVVSKLIEKYSKNTNPKIKVDLLDGIRISFEDGWALARASNTQPVLVVRYESWTEAGLKRISDEMESEIKKYL